MYRTSSVISVILNRVKEWLLNSPNPRERKLWLLAINDFERFVRQSLFLHVDFLYKKITSISYDLTPVSFQMVMVWGYGWVGKAVPRVGKRASVNTDDQTINLKHFM